MAWLRKVPKSPYWQAIVCKPDGTRTTRSTRTTNKREAQKILVKITEAEEAGKDGKLTEKIARKIISDLYANANKDSLDESSIEEYFQSWLKRKQIESSESTASRYTPLINRFIGHLGNKAKLDLLHLSHKDIVKARDKVASTLTTSTANLMVKAVRAALNQAIRDGLLDTNEADKITQLKQTKPKSRRPFTSDELRRLMNAADFEWKGMMLCAIYTGQRLTDIALLTWQNLDLANAQLIFKTRKTGRSMAIPLAKRLQEYMGELPAGDDPSAPLFPAAFARRSRNNNAGPLSNQFYNLMVKAGIAEKKTHTKQGEGRSSKRKTNNLSFHCLRHTATSMLKNAGVSDAVARDIIGHDSEAISRQYTHIDLAAKRKAIEALPDLFE